MDSDKLKGLIGVWAEMRNTPVNDTDFVEYLGIEMCVYLDNVIAEIYDMIHAADFHPDSKVERVQDLIKAVNACQPDNFNQLTSE